MLFPYQQIKKVVLDHKNIEEKEERQDITTKLSIDRGIRNRANNPQKYKN